MFKITRFNYIIFYILAHLSIIPMVMYAEWHHWLYAFIFFKLTVSINMIIYHRFLTHKSFDCPNWFLYFGSIVSAIGASGSSIGWVAIHRAHHIHADTKKDPHSPEFTTIIAHIFPRLFVESLVPLRHSQDLLKSKFQLWIHNNYWVISLIYLLIISSLFGWFSIIYLYFFPSLLKPYTGAIMNICNHKFGYRNFETRDNSRNSPFLIPLVGGEAWHNNHHANPNSPDSGKSVSGKWWEIDPDYYVIKLVLAIDRLLPK